jgi:WD40 repeat protein
VKVSPDGSRCVFGTHGGLSYIEIVGIDSSGNLSYLKKLSKNLTSALLHVDWTSDGTSIVVNSQSYDLQFFDVDGDCPIRASSTKTWKYHTWTNKLGWASQGALQGVDMTDLNDVCRSREGNVLAIGEDSSLVKLFKYPCLEAASAKQYKAHSSHVVRVRFTIGDNYLISAGGNDKTVIVWKTDFGVEKEEGGDNMFEEADQDEGDQAFEGMEDDNIEYTSVAIEEKVRVVKKSRPTIEEVEAK